MFLTRQHIKTTKYYIPSVGNHASQASSIMNAFLGVSEIIEMRDRQCIADMVREEKVLQIWAFCCDTQHMHNFICSFLIDSFAIHFFEFAKSAVDTTP